MNWVGLGWFGVWVRWAAAAAAILRLNSFGVNAVFDWGLGVGVTTDHYDGNNRTVILTLP